MKAGSKDYTETEQHGHIQSMKKRLERVMN